MNTRTRPTVRTLFLSLFVLPILALFAAPSQAAEPLPAPDLTGVWTGKISGKYYSQETGDKPVSVKYVVEAVITQIDSDITIEATLTDKDGDESSYSLQGKAGNRIFWGYNGVSNEPTLILGKVAGKLPKLSISGKGTSVDGSGGFSELKVSLKRSKTGVLGTSATGAPVVGATVTLKDRNGTSVSTETDADGRYSLNVFGLTPPFLVKVDPLAGNDLYGIASAAGVANVTPFTTLILDMWYGVQDLGAVADVFATIDENTPMPTALDVALIESLVRRTILKWLQDNGIDADSFNLLTTPFEADGTGVDAVLDDTTIAGDTLTVDDGTTSQTSSIVVNDVAGTVTIDSTTTSPSGTSEFTDGTAIPDGDAAQAAVAGALATMQAFRNKINTRGAALSLADLQGYGTVDFLDEGSNRTRWFGEAASDLRGGSLGPVTLKSVRYFDGDLLGLDLELHVNSQEGEGTEILRMDFKKTGSAWLMYGNREIAQFSVDVEYRTDYFAGSTDGPNKHINVDVRAATGSISSVTISGATVFDGQTVPKSNTTEINVYEPTPGTEVQYESDVYYIGADFEEYPAPGTPVTLTITPTGGSPIEYVVLTGATTTEAISLIQPTGHDLATHAHPGTPVTVEWTVPTSFAIQRFNLNGFAFSDDPESDAEYEIEVDPDGNPVIGDTTGTITFPTTVNGFTINRANINLGFNGPNGERIHIIYDFQNL